MTILVTGGAGFIGCNFVLDWFKHSDEPVVTLDKLTYAGHLTNLSAVKTNPNHHFLQGDIGDAQLVLRLITEHDVRAIIHFAAESHVDRSIQGPEAFIQTNIVGTFQLLNTVRQYWSTLEQHKKTQFRFLHVSTDEVYGTLEPHDAPFTEQTAYAPNSPYAASKASSDHLVRAYFHTYGVPTLTTNCSNNYGPFQHPEKLIPLCIKNALTHQPLPIYGNGLQVRDWLYVTDHCNAIRRVLAAGVPGEVYNIGGWNEKTNLHVVNTLCNLLDQIKPRQDGLSYTQQITYVTDRPGHDKRYAIDASKIEHDLDWRPKETFETGLQQTLQWYVSHAQEFFL